MTMKVEKGIPIPHRSGDGTRKYPFDQMEVGDSFLCNGFDPGKISSAGYHFGLKSEPKKKFSIKKTPEGHRCWRVL